MLKKRLAAGSLLAAAIGLVLVADARLAPYYPILAAFSVLIAVLASWELPPLVAPELRPNRGLVLGGTVAVVLANWVVPVQQHLGRELFGPLAFADPWHPVLLAFTGVVLAAFLIEMQQYPRPGSHVARIAVGVWAVAYMGLLPSFLLKLRWFDGGANPALSSWLVALTVFVPKCADIGAYAVGRLIGRTPFAPKLSPKKTWEGFAGGLAAGVAPAVALESYIPVFRGGLPEAVGFGLAVGCAGVLGDLAESLVKRDSFKKDAAASIPGFGGVLDVMDSILFAAPVSYLWLARG